MLRSMFGMGGTEILVILIVALLFLGPDKLPDAAKKISKGIRDIKKQSRALQRTIEDDEHIGGAIRDLKSALRGEDEPIRPKPIKPPKQLVEPASAPALPEPGAPEHAGAHAGEHAGDHAGDHGASAAVADAVAVAAVTSTAEHETSAGELTLRGVVAPTAPSDSEPGSEQPIDPTGEARPRAPASPSVRSAAPALAPAGPAAELGPPEPTIRGVVAPRPPETAESPQPGEHPKLTLPPTAGEPDGARPSASADAELAALVKPAPNTIPRSSAAPTPAPAEPAVKPADTSESKHG